MISKNLYIYFFYTLIDITEGISLLVRAESDGSLLLESKIQPDTAYQKQQDTLIVWSEGDNFDLALSFQEKAGCDEIWEKICQVCVLEISFSDHYRLYVVHSILYATVVGFFW